MHQDVRAEDFRTNGNGVENGREDRVSEILEGVERNLNDLVQGLSLLGIKRCLWCRKFYRAEPGALFAGAGGLVCFECIPAWWPARREELSCGDRQKTETNLVFWLRSFHNARSFNGSGKPAGQHAVKFELVASCLECRGTGTYMGDKRCRHCAGPGSVRVVVPSKTT